jgi:signal transduction histidine kinase
VKDTGPGVSNQDELFALFKSTKQNSDTEGLGLGLSLSRKIIRAYEGDLALHSTSVNGAEFIIKIPRVSYAAE